MSYRTKLTVLAVVIAAILYVRISPLPQLAAHSSLKAPLVTFITVVILFFTPLLRTQLPVLRVWTDRFSERDTLLAHTCVRLC